MEALFYIFIICCRWMEREECKANIGKSSSDKLRSLSRFDEINNATSHVTSINPPKLLSAIKS